MGIKAIATNDVHYARKSDHKYHDILLAMQTKDTVKNPDRFTFDSDDFYLKTYEEMMELYGKAPELLSNTVEISEKIESPSLFMSGKDLLPYYQVPEGFSNEEDYLKKMVKDGMIAKGLIDKPEYRERIRFEMQTIIKCGYTRYFLILWDVINYARNNSIRIGVGRGSAAGSLCLYVLGVIQLDPIKYDLLFERFLNPERVSPPDVDVDFDDTRRE
jgi:DNA polymerase-3 subunit alpha